MLVAGPRNQFLNSCQSIVEVHSFQVRFAGCCERVRVLINFHADGECLRTFVRVQHPDGDHVSTHDSGRDDSGETPGARCTQDGARSRHKTGRVGTNAVGHIQLEAEVPVRPLYVTVAVPLCDIATSNRLTPGAPPFEAGTVCAGVDTICRGGGGTVGTSGSGSRANELGFAGVPTQLMLDARIAAASPALTVTEAIDLSIAFIAVPPTCKRGKMAIDRLFAEVVDRDAAGDCASTPSAATTDKNNFWRLRLARSLASGEAAAGSKRKNSQCTTDSVCRPLSKPDFRTVACTILVVSSRGRCLGRDVVDNPCAP
jgi:hypothetical protein